MKNCKCYAVINCVTYLKRVTPFFDTINECEKYIKENNIKYHCIHWTSNWKQLA